jgi:hypothetical protein
MLEISPSMGFKVMWAYLTYLFLEKEKEELNRMWLFLKQPEKKEIIQNQTNTIYTIYYRFHWHQSKVHSF